MLFNMDDEHEVTLLTTITKKLKRKVKLNRKRRLRRKRSKKVFLLKLKEERARRYTENLCDELGTVIQFEEPSSMDYNIVPESTYDTAQFATKSHEDTVRIVSDWQHQHQVAYWKSRAIALQIENQALHKQIKHLYSQQMDQYLNAKKYYADWKQVEHEITERTQPKHHQQTNKIEKYSKKHGKLEEDVELNRLAPTEQPDLARRKEMEELYGEQAAKIIGMETAMDLNFDYCVKRTNATHWPNIPLKL